MNWRVGVLKGIARLVVMLCAAGTAVGQVAAPALQTETDEYTRYEVTATTAGTKYYFNPIRKGSVASGESVVDLITGQPLRFEVVSGDVRHSQGLVGEVLVDEIEYRVRHGNGVAGEIAD
jgi:hypothetical protein